VPGGEEYPSLVRWSDRERDVLTEPMDKIDDEIIACLLSEREYAIRGEEIAGGALSRGRRGCRASGWLRVPLRRRW
jgi:hypothetical protein